MLYVYCVVDKPGTIGELTNGLAGGVIESIEINGLIALFSEFPGDTVSVLPENVMTHDAAVGGVLRKTTPLPFRFGTLVTRAQLVSFLEARCDALKLKLAEVRDCVEMSVKVIWTPVRPQSADLEAQDRTRSPGAAFLEAKRQEILGDEALVAGAKQLNSWLHERVNMFVRQESVMVRPSQKLVLAASHLVERSQLASYQEAVKGAVEERRDLHFLSSGPWAPYSFVNIDLEFKTHFGVS